MQIKGLVDNNIIKNIDACGRCFQNLLYFVVSSCNICMLSQEPLKYRLLFRVGNNAKRNFLEIKLKSVKRIKRPREAKCFVNVECGYNFLFLDSAITDRLYQATKFVCYKCE